MNRLVCATLLSTIATAREQREHATLAQLMMLHDEMVGKLDEPNNDVDANASLYDQIFGSGE